MKNNLIRFSNLLSSSFSSRSIWLIIRDRSSHSMTELSLTCWQVKIAIAPTFISRNTLSCLITCEVCSVNFLAYILYYIQVNVTIFIKIKLKFRYA